MKDDNKNKVIFNSTEGKSHLLDYFIDKIMPINTTISDKMKMISARNGADTYLIILTDTFIRILK